MTRHICLISLLLSSGNGLLPVQAEMLSQESTQQEAQESETGQSSNATSAAATSPMTIYKVVGKDGSVTYTDKPQQNAEPLAFDVKTQNVVTAAKVTPPPPAKPAAPKPNYRVVIKSPAPEATIRNNLGEFTISAAQPGAPKAPIYRLIFDDAPLASNSSGVFKLTGIHRGAHTYKVELTNNTGKTLASSPLQTLYLHQASALINN
ncbi:MAG: DUF4124 domain-containing protein [Alteromonas macleodii]|jgi:hypothetical protein|uniref:DUF4124 domain-containing protein n=2 Tax=Alteromonas TaxID=226 RepID=UPI0001AEBA92|nr:MULTISPECIES: DUF4124 domain-containing protein [Alteromonas]MEC7082706.1 DUF4124 domain-containing protein [Pseudomonadota bacterium]MCG7650585.1 DUF4124 domain-containing protein [Alteromonas sp. MmMcT2-5]MCS5577307.1 DUF4124 domain-containing protein [Alteromonas macleodii]MCZ4240852.1 DUF4124 domain-containing protein [Alteromonas macleodii]MDM7961235.1 DUF4124 domain-containing protein [Alteromonas macleodii]|tara:strand:- start:1676 stop:2293 length:618 start_codon:yes stop_codon:yes gene_type:complete